MTEEYGLIGYPLGHSFSAKYFGEKFAREGIDATYTLFPLENFEEDYAALLAAHKHLKGLNVTIPYKQDIIGKLDAIDDTAREVGAVNVVKFAADGRKIGYNSDVVGFETSLRKLWKPTDRHALILGTGGASKAVAYVLRKMGVEYTLVSRSGGAGRLRYEDVDEAVIQKNTLIVNASPLGTYPHVETCPNIPYEALTSGHYLFDLVYNPAETLFLKRGRERGARVKNGLEMLEGQAIAAWEIWQRKD